MVNQMLVAGQLSCRLAVSSRKGMDNRVALQMHAGLELDPPTAVQLMFLIVSERRMHNTV